MINKIWKFSFLLSILGIIILTTIYIFTSNVNFKINGKSDIELELNEVYNDEGFTAKVFKWDLSQKVKIYDNIKNDIVGSYRINYKLSFIGKEYVLFRYINVVDKIPPTIKLKGNDEIKLYVGEKYNEAGVEAYDNYDQDISNLIKIESNLDVEKEGSYQIIYSVKDSSGNESSVIRNITIEKKKETTINKIETTKENYNINDPIVKYIKEKNIMFL